MERAGVAQSILVGFRSTLDHLPLSSSTDDNPENLSNQVTINTLANRMTRLFWRFFWKFNMHVHVVMN